MAADIVPELLEKIQRAFERAMRMDVRVHHLRQRVTRKGASYADTYEYAKLVSKHCSAAILAFLTEENLPDGKLYYNIAQRIMSGNLSSCYNLITAVCKDVQRQINTSIGVGLNPVDVGIEQERIDNIPGYLTDLDTLEQQRAEIEGITENFNLHTVDKNVEENMKFQGASGLKAYIVRTARPGACQKCQDLAGRYDYKSAVGDKKIWIRHKHCACTLEYFAERDYRRVWG